VNLSIKPAACTQNVSHRNLLLKRHGMPASAGQLTPGAVVIAVCILYNIHFHVIANIAYYYIHVDNFRVHSCVSALFAGQCSVR
jgi:hypothetical protein